ncbi:MAG: cytochrome c oxidase subunit 3, partial [Pseudomonadota bacterium]
MSAGEQKHPYHLVDPSPWPVVGSFAALLLFGGAVMAMHDTAGGIYILIAGAIGVAFTMVMWWRDVTREAEVQGHHTPIVQIGLRYGMALFIASEVMFFAA